MNYFEFHNALRILLNIDADEFFAATRPELGGARPSDVVMREWITFRDDPHKWMLRAPSDKAQMIFEIVERRL